MSTITVTPLGFAAGAQLTGVDLGKPLTELQQRQINKAWLEHIVLVFPGQDLTPAQQIAFTGSFGTLDQHESQAPTTLHPEHREILVLSNKVVNGKKSGTYNSGRNWHTDLSYTPRLAKGAVIHCKEKPPVGGDTMWANLYLALETLSPSIRKLIDDLEAVHDVTLVRGIELRAPEVVAEMKKRNPAVIHPVVRTHPETGRKSLLVNQRIRRFVGMSDEESQSLLAMLNAHATSPEFVYRHRWSLGDVVMWDNRCSCHVALGDFDQTKPRVMYRCSLQGEVESGRIADDAGGADRQSMLQAVAAVS
jgi:taurine dioxygenase